MAKNKLHSSLPEPPEWLAENEIAFAEWRRMLDLNPGLGDPARAALLASYCLNFARWRAAETAIEVDGTEVVIRDDKGVVKGIIPSVQVGISVKYHDRMLKSLAALGVTGRDKTRGLQSSGLSAFDASGLRN